jgi:hypothetical protein
MVAGEATRSWLTGRRFRLGLLTLLVGLAQALSLAPMAAAEGAPFEPNDAITAAAGPLAFGQAYTARIETASDRDFYFFYVTSPPAAQVELTVQNLGGGERSSDVDVAILDTSVTPLAAQAFIHDGETRIVSAELEPQKYFVEVTAKEGFGDSYSLTGGGDAGAFGPYAQVSGRCASASAAVAAGRTRLSRAKSKLQRATARVRRSRYATAAARAKARAAHSKAKQHVNSRRRALRAARESREPWCSIAP